MTNRTVQMETDSKWVELSIAGDDEYGTCDTQSISDTRTMNVQPRYSSNPSKDYDYDSACIWLEKTIARKIRAGFVIVSDETSASIY